MLGIGTYVAIYFIVWWTVLFAVLPWGVRSQAEDGDVSDGTEPGAPSRPRLGLKAATTTLIAAVVVGLFAYSVESGLLTLDMFPMPFETD